MHVSTTYITRTRVPSLFCGHAYLTFSTNGTHNVDLIELPCHLPPSCTMWKFHHAHIPQALKAFIQTQSAEADP